MESSIFFRSRNIHFHNKYSSRYPLQSLVFATATLEDFHCYRGYNKLSIFITTIYQTVKSMQRNFSNFQKGGIFSLQIKTTFTV